MKITEYIEALSKLPPHLLEKDISDLPITLFQNRLVIACNFPGPNCGHGVIVYNDGAWKSVFGKG